MKKVKTAAKNTFKPKLGPSISHTVYPLDYNKNAQVNEKDVLEWREYIRQSLLPNQNESLGVVIVSSRNESVPRFIKDVISDILNLESVLSQAKDILNKGGQNGR